jgi:chromosome segregation ATPase
VLAEAIVKARQDWATQQQQQLDELNQQIPVVSTRLKEAKDAIAADIEAMKQREADLNEQLLALQKTIDETTQQAIATAEEAERVREEAARRREDVLRLRNQLSELRTDRFRAEEQQKKLEDLLVRVNGDIGRLERRKQQLQDAGARLPEKDYPPAEGKPEAAEETPADKNAA